MLNKSLVAATVALMYGATAQAGGPLLPRLQSGLKQLPALTAPVVATTRSLTSIKALPALSAPVLSGAALPGLTGVDAKVSPSYYYPPMDPGSGADWLDYNLTIWPGQIGPFAFNAVAVAQEFSTDLGAVTLTVTGVLGNGPCNCAGGTPIDVVDRASYFLSTILDFGLSRGAGLGKKIGPIPLPKRPGELEGLDPTFELINQVLVGPGGSPA